MNKTTVITKLKWVCEECEKCIPCELVIDDHQNIVQDQPLFCPFSQGHTPEWILQESA